MCLGDGLEVCSLESLGRASLNYTALFCPPPCPPSTTSSEFYEFYPKLVLSYYYSTKFTQRAFTNSLIVPRSSVPVPSPQNGRKSVSSLIATAKY
jgi:hypothetical protein